MFSSYQQHGAQQTPPTQTPNATLESLLQLDLTKWNDGCLLLKLQTWDSTWILLPALDPIKYQALWITCPLLYHKSQNNGLSDVQIHGFHPSFQ